MRITTKKTKKPGKPVTVRLDDRTLAIARAEARAAGLSLSAFLAKLAKAGIGQSPDQAQTEAIQQVAQAAMLSAQLAVECLAHEQIMHMPSPTQRQQIEQKRSELYSLHFSPSTEATGQDPEAQPQAQPDSPAENEIQEATL